MTEQPHSRNLVLKNVTSSGAIRSLTVRGIIDSFAALSSRSELPRGVLFLTEIIAKQALSVREQTLARYQEEGTVLDFQSCIRGAPIATLVCALAH